MRKIKVLVLLCLAASMFLVGCSDNKGRNVNEVVNDPNALNGPLQIVGIMAGMSQDPSVLGIMDKQELKCKSPNCEKIILPVRYKGKMPVRGDEVLVSGSFVKDVSGYVFSAEKLKVVKHHQLPGGQ